MIKLNLMSLQECLGDVTATSDIQLCAEMMQYDLSICLSVQQSPAIDESNDGSRVVKTRQPRNGADCIEALVQFPALHYYLPMPGAQGPAQLAAYSFRY